MRSAYFFKTTLTNSSSTLFVLAYVEATFHQTPTYMQTHKWSFEYDPRVRFSYDFPEGSAPKYPVVHTQVAIFRLILRSAEVCREFRTSTGQTTITAAHSRDCIEMWLVERGRSTGIEQLRSRQRWAGRMLLRKRLIYIYWAHGCKLPSISNECTPQGAELIIKNEAKKNLETQNYAKILSNGKDRTQLLPRRPCLIEIIQFSKRTSHFARNFSPSDAHYGLSAASRA